MGERALAVCWRGDDSVDCYRAQWAGRESTVAGVLSAAEPLDALCPVEWAYGSRIPTDEWVETLDYLSLDVVFVVSPHEVSVWLPLWFGLPAVDGPVEPSLGALVRVETVTELRRRRRQFRVEKGLVQDGIDCGLLPVAGALALLGCSLASADVWGSRSLLNRFPTTTV